MYRLFPALVLALAACGGKEEPADTDPAADTDAVDTDAVDTDAGDTDVTDTDPADTDPVDTDTGGPAACGPVGTWVGQWGPAAKSEDGELVFDATTYTAVLDAGGVAGRVMGTWTLSGADLAITDTSADGDVPPCPPTDVGAYTVTFSADCAGMGFTAVQDGCLARAMLLHGAAFVRQ